MKKVTEVTETTKVGLNKDMTIKWLSANSKKGFLLLAGLNRAIVPYHVTKMSISVDRMGIVRPVVIATLSFITGKPEKYIIDGQHLYTSCLRNKIDVPYVEINITDKVELVEKIALLNSSSKSWCMQDYVIAWSSLKEDYVKLNRYFEIYDFEFGIIASILNNQALSSAVGGASVNKKIKEGTFQIFNEDVNVKILDNLTDVLRIVKRQARNENRYICSEYVNFYRNCADYDHKKFIKNLKAEKELFVLATQEEGKLNELFQKLK
jgi:hypothetical protein